IVIDIGRAHEVLKAILAPLNYRNLDELPDLKGFNTTTEFLTRHIFDRQAKAARAGELGRDGRQLKAIRVTLSESHLGRAWDKGDLWGSAWHSPCRAISRPRPVAMPMTGA